MTGTLNWLKVRRRRGVRRGLPVELAKPVGSVLLVVLLIVHGIRISLRGIGDMRR